MNNLNDIFFTPAASEGLTYEKVLEDVQRYFSENHASTIAEAGEGNTLRAAAVLKELMIQYLVKRKYAIDGFTTEELCARLYEDMAGYSFLKKWIYKPGVEEVNINAYNDIEVIMNSGRSIKIPDKFSSPQHAIDVVRRMLNACGMVIDDTMPSVIGFLDKNIRISVDKTPIVDPDVGINASIRIVNQQTVSEQKLLNSGSATAEMLHFLTACIRYGVSVCIAGSTGSGKTTIMAWLLSNVPNNRRLITIEEGSREFDLIKRDENGNILNSVVHLLTRPHENPSMNINQDFLLERVLRKHPDVIGVGEMRSAAESLSAAESSRTGHTVCTTIHSNSCDSTYRRMMTLAKRKYNMDDSILMQIMVEAYPVVVFTKQLEDRSRKIMEIIEGEDYQDGHLLYRSLYKYEVVDNVTDANGEIHVIGHHSRSGQISDALKKRLLDNGISHKELEEFMGKEAY
ncbi:CpaF/VirB11 family protein [Lachnoclostridium edouardi]|uniref:CpaF/VirB11 family protein n=1 Tax=Lachnoclostridium edouardi TaxID=1926283 RepID=UPI000C7C5D1B|nr:CpaF/VirB11 family protein [Lachnoclostridium edouardi]